MTGQLKQDGHIGHYMADSR